jgi:hypothetical protein
MTDTEKVCFQLYNEGKARERALVFLTPDERRRLAEKRAIEADNSIDREPIDRAAIAVDYAEAISLANAPIKPVAAFSWDESDDL